MGRHILHKEIPVDSGCDDYLNEYFIIYVLFLKTLLMISGNIVPVKKDPESIKGGSKGATDLEPF